MFKEKCLRGSVKQLENILNRKASRFYEFFRVSEVSF